MCEVFIVGVSQNYGKTYTYHRKNVAEGEPWEFSGLDHLHTLLGAATGTPVSPNVFALGPAVEALSTQGKLHMTELAFASLMLMGNGKLSLFMQQPGVLGIFGRKSYAETYHLDSTNFNITIKDFFKALKKADFNTWGPFIHIVKAIEEFSSTFPKKRFYHLKIEINGD